MTDLSRRQLLIGLSAMAAAAGVPTLPVAAAEIDFDLGPEPWDWETFYRLIKREYEKIIGHPVLPATVEDELARATASVMHDSYCLQQNLMRQLMPDVACAADLDKFGTLYDGLDDNTYRTKITARIARVAWSGK